MAPTSSRPLRPALKNSYQRKEAGKRREKLRASGGAQYFRPRWVQFDFTEVGSAFSKPNHGRQRSTSRDSEQEARERERAWKIKRQKIYDALDQEHGFSHPRPSTVVGPPRRERSWSRERDRRMERGPRRDWQGKGFEEQMGELSMSEHENQGVSMRASRSGRSQSQEFDQRTARRRIRSMPRQPELKPPRRRSRSHGIRKELSGPNAFRRRSRSADLRFEERGNGSEISNGSASRRFKAPISSIEKWIWRVGDVL